VSPQQVSYRVEEGVVALAGTLSSDDQRAALLALVEGVPGVKDVRDGCIVARGLAGKPA